MSDRRYRTWTRWFGVGLASMGGVGLTVSLATEPRELTPFATALHAAPIVIGGVLFFESLFTTTTERTAELWKAGDERSSSGLAALVGLVLLFGRRRRRA